MRLSLDVRLPPAAPVLHSPVVVAPTGHGGSATRFFHPGSGRPSQLSHCCCSHAICALFSVGRPKHTRVMAGALEGDLFIGNHAQVSAPCTEGLLIPAPCGSCDPMSDRNVNCPGTSRHASNYTPNGTWSGDQLGRHGANLELGLHGTSQNNSRGSSW